MPTVLDLPDDGRCPICGSERFTEHSGREGALCTGCGALERHRSLVLMHEQLLRSGRGRTALEIGALNRRVFGDFLRERGWRYMSVDASTSGNPADPRSVESIDIRADAREMSDVADGDVELVIVQHVIEEIPEYERALAEIARVLAQRGSALLEIPFDPDRAHSTAHGPDRFGNVWSFGRDLLHVVGRHFARVEPQEYRMGASHGWILMCRHLSLNPVAVENRREGDSDWWGPHAPTRSIEGYPSQCSIRPGERLELHVSTNPAARYRITVHRLGWYGGAGGRTVAVHPAAGSDVQGLAREQAAVGPGPHVESCGWPVTDVILLDQDLPTGVYVARLTLTTGVHAGRSSFVPFVMRPRLGTSADVLVQQPVTTTQAYNNFGGKSLYPSNSTDQHPAVKVTFDRPYAAWSEANLNARWPFVWDYQLLRYLEREEIDVAYTTDVDTHREPWSVVGYQLLMTSGHDEYWTREMRDAFDDARDASANIACMGANTCYWQMRFEDRERTMVEYRSDSGDPERDRALQTVKFRDLEPPRPECELLGIQYQEGLTPTGLPPRDYELTKESIAHPWMRDTGFEYPTTLHGLVGYEWDALVPGLEPLHRVAFFHYDCPELSHADAVLHHADSGALVFAAGSLQFAWGLDDWGHDGHADERLQCFMRNALAELTTPRGEA